MADQPRLYSELAGWFHLLTAPEDYAEEAHFYQQAIISACGSTPQTLLELGSGGGNNASHLKKRFDMTLVDLSQEMLKISQELNPECPHIQGDMRSIRLGGQFDAVFIHDAIVYMQSEDDLAQAIGTAYVHCKLGGAALFAPDFTRETFKPSTSNGGHDGKNRSLRYLEWVIDPDPADTTYISDMVYLLREGQAEVRCVLDRHTCGLFSRADWLRLIEAAGFKAQALLFEHSEITTGSADVFLGIKQV